MDSIFSKLTEDEVFNFIKLSIQSTLVLDNPKSIKFTLNKIENDIKSELKKREEKLKLLNGNN